MYYFNLYQKKLIPQMGLKDLYEQRDLLRLIRKTLCRGSRNT
jgi:hypothetical protein